MNQQTAPDRNRRVDVDPDPFSVPIPQAQGRPWRPPHPHGSLRSESVGPSFLFGSPGPAAAAVKIETLQARGRLLLPLPLLLLHLPPDSSGKRRRWQQVHAARHWARTALDTSASSPLSGDDVPGRGLSPSASAAAAATRGARRPPDQEAPPVSLGQPFLSPGAAQRTPGRPLQPALGAREMVPGNACREDQSGA